MVCKNCIKFKVHGKKCWFYWEGKSACSRFEDGLGERFNDIRQDFSAAWERILYIVNSK